MVTEEEMISLIESLELAKLRKMNEHAPQASIHKQDIDDMHRTFHFVTVQWAQAMGFDGRRR
jgi:hypothetical protein